MGSKHYQDCNMNNNIENYTLTCEGELGDQALISIKVSDPVSTTILKGFPPNSNIFPPSSNLVVIGLVPHVERIKVLFNQRPWSCKIDYGTERGIKSYSLTNYDMNLPDVALINPDSVIFIIIYKEVPK